MMPLLFNANSLTYNNNQLGQFKEVTNCSVKEELNGTYELNMTFLKSDPIYPQVSIGKIVLAKPNKLDSPQPFIIEQLNKTINGEITVYATHIAQHRAKLIPISPFTANSLQQAINRIRTNALERYIFIFTTDKTSNVQYVLEEPRSLRDVMGNKEGSLVDKYGGEYLYNYTDIFLLKRRGKEDVEINISYGHNMTKYTQVEEFSYAQSITGVLPYYKSTEEDTPDVVMGDIQYSNYVDDYPYHKTITYDFTDKFEEKPTVAQLNQVGKEYVRYRGKALLNIKASFEDVSTLPQYNQLYNQIDNIQLGDSVRIINAEYNTNVVTRIRELDYDVLLDRYNTITIGDASTTINDAIGGASSQTTINNYGGTYYAGSGIEIVDNVISNAPVETSGQDKVFSSGLIIKTGNVNLPHQTETTVNFTRSFPNVCFGVWTTPYESDYTPASTISVKSFGEANTVLYQSNANSSTIKVRWIAIGF